MNWEDLLPPPAECSARMYRAGECPDWAYESANLGYAFSPFLAIVLIVALVVICFAIAEGLAQIAEPIHDD